LVKITSVSAPTALLDIAATGTTNWTELRRQFPDAAHAALRADTQASAQTGVFGKLGAFLKNQIGTRSLQRQEGNTTDAILSRIEDELVRGNLETTRTEADALPESAKAAISGWLTDLEHLTAAQSALAQLSSTLGVAN